MLEIADLRIDALNFDRNKEPYILPLPIKDLLLISRPSFTDSRGSFQEVVRPIHLEGIIGRKVEFKQVQVSRSMPDVLRGIHAENQDKLIFPLTGKLLQVFVDLRPDSSSFKKWISFPLDLSNPLSFITTFFVPKGIGNAFYVYPDSDLVIYPYAVSSEYDPSQIGHGVKFDDPELAIVWPNLNPQISDRDKKMPSLKEFLEKFK